MKGHASKRNALTLSDEQEQAQRALGMADRAASHLGRFQTAAGILADGAGDAIDLDDFLFHVEEIARECFNGGRDIELALMQAMKVEASDKRIGDLVGQHDDECLAQSLSAFALGVSWGLMQGGLR